VFQAVRAFVKISGELPMMVLANHKYSVEKLFLEVSKVGQVESPRGNKKKSIRTVVLDVFLYGL